jgi:hypothetical protein
MGKDNPVMSSFMWSERLGVPLPDPLPWDLYALLTEAEFNKRVGTTNSKK